MFGTYKENYSFEDIINILKTKKIVYYDSEFVRIKHQENEIFELIQIGMTDLKNNFEMKVKHSVKIPIREQIILGINKDGYSQNGHEFPVVFKKLNEWTQNFTFDYVVAFSHGEDLEVFKIECNKANIEYPRLIEKVIDIAKVMKSFYKLSEDLSLKNFCYLYDVDLDKRYKKKVHEALSDAFNTGLLCEYFLNNLNNKSINKDYIEGFIFALSKYNNSLEKNIKNLKQSTLCKKNSGFQVKNSLFKNSNTEMMEFMLLNSIPNEKKENEQFMLGVKKVLNKFIKNKS